MKQLGLISLLQFFLIVCNPKPATAQDSVQFVLVIKTLFEQDSIAKDVFATSGDANFSYLLLNEAFLHLQEFNELALKTNIPSSHYTFLYCSTSKGDIYLISQSTLHLNTDIKFVVIDKIRIGKRRATVKMHTSGNYWVGAPDRSYQQFYCKLNKADNHWFISKMKREVRKCCDKL